MKDATFCKCTWGFINVTFRNERNTISDICIEQWNDSCSPTVNLSLDIIKYVVATRIWVFPLEILPIQIETTSVMRYREKSSCYFPQYFSISIRIFDLCWVSKLMFSSNATPSKVYCGFSFELVLLYIANRTISLLSVVYDVWFFILQKIYTNFYHFIEQTDGCSKQDLSCGSFTTVDNAK